MLEQLEPNERINAISKLLPYILPKQSEVLTIEPERPKSVIIRFKENENDD